MKVMVEFHLVKRLCLKSLMLFLVLFSTLPSKFSNVPSGFGKYHLCPYEVFKWCILVYPSENF